MKSFLLKIVSIILTVNIAVVAMAGEKAGNGGDEIGSQFYKLGSNLIKSLRNHEAELVGAGILKLNDIALFEKAHKLAAIRSQETVLLNGLEVDAVNKESDSRVDGRPLIIVGSKRWVLKKRMKKYDLVAHEYFGVFGVEVTTYEKSQLLTEIYIEAIQRDLLDQGIQSQHIDRMNITDVCRLTIDRIENIYEIIGRSNEFVHNFLPVRVLATRVASIYDGRSRFDAEGEHLLKEMIEKIQTADGMNLSSEVEKQFLPILELSYKVQSKPKMFIRK